METSLYELVQHSAWMDLQDIHEMDHGQTFLPGFLKSFATDRTLTAIIYAKNKSCRSKLACSSDRKRYGLLCNAQLEIRELFGQKRAYRAGILQDEFPQWCKLHWSSSNDLLFLARSKPILDAFDCRANYVFGIKLEQPSVVFDAALAISSMYCQKWEEEEKWTDRLFILQYNGCLRCYKIGLSKGYSAVFSVQLSSVVAGPFTFILGSPKASLFVVASAFVTPKSAADQATAQEFGLSIWRNVEQEPYMVPFRQDDSDPLSLTQSKSVSLGGMFSSRGFVVDLSMNVSETMLAFLTSLNDIFVCAFPSLRLCNFFPANSMSGPKDKVGQHPLISPLAVDWWSSKELIVLFDNGSIISQQWDQKEDVFSWRNCLHTFDYHCQRVDGNAGQQFYIETWKAFEGDTSLPLGPSIPSLIFKLPYYYAKWLMYIFFGGSSSPTDLATYAVNCTLWEMKSVNPIEVITTAVRITLQDGDFENASIIAEHSNLSVMKICKKLWRNRDVKVDAIDKYLIHIDDKKWVLHQCLIKPTDHPDQWLHLLEYGITLSMDLHLASQSDVSPYLKPLFKLSRRWIMLKDALEIGWLSENAAALHPERMRMISSLNPLSFAFQMAVVSVAQVGLGICSSSSLRAVFSRFYLLGCIHFSVKIKNMQILLPIADDALKKRPSNPREFPVSSKEVDFSDCALFGPKLKSDKDLLAAFPCETKPPCLFIDTELPDRKSIVEWYQWRCSAVEKYTGWPDYCLHLLNFAICEGGLKELMASRYEYYLVTVLVYDSSYRELTHSIFMELNPVEVASRLLRPYLGSPKLPEQFKRLIIPYFEYCQREHSVDVIQVLRELLATESQKSLRTVCSLLCPADECILSLFDSCPEEYIFLLNDCLCLCDDVVNVEDVSKLLLSAENIQSRCGVVSSEHRHLLTLMRNQLEAYRILQAAGQQCTFHQLETTRRDSDECEKLLQKVVQSTIPEVAVGGQNGLNVAIETAHDFVRFSRLNIEPEMVVSLFAKELLFSGNGKLLDEVEAIIQTDPTDDPSSPFLLGCLKKLPYAQACNLVLEATRFYANQAGDKTFKNLALKCLGLIKCRSSDLEREYCFLQALPILSKLGIPDSPEYLRPIVCEGDLIGYILKEIPDAYKSLDDIQLLATLLFPNMDARERITVVSIRCAEQAVRLGDMVHIVVYCNRIVRETWTSGWHVCYLAAEKLLSGGRCPDLKDDFRQECARQFLEFAILNGQAPYLEKIVRDFERVSASLNYIKTSESDKLEHLGRILFSCSPGTSGYNKENETEKNKEVQDFLKLESEVAGSSLPLTEGKESKMRTLMRSIGVQAVLTDPTTAASILLSLPTSEDVLFCLQPHLHRADIVAFAIYIMSLRLVMKHADETLTAGKLLQFDPVSVIEFILNCDGLDDSEEVNMIKTWLDSIETLNIRFALDKTHPEMDSEKFLADEEYRRETILGLALSTDKGNYETALHLAEKFSVSVWDVQMDHLEYILTDSGLQPDEIMAHVKELNLLDKLACKPDGFVARMEQNVFGMLDGNDYDRLQLYYAILKLCGQLVAGNEIPRQLSDASQYRMILQNLKQHWIEVDFVKLLSSQPDDLTVLLPCLTAKNFLLVAKLIMKLPGKASTEESIVICGKTLDKLSDSGFLSFVRKVLFSDDVATELSKTKFNHDSFVKAIEKYATSKDRSDSTMHELRRYLTFSSNVEALMASVPANMRVYVDTQIRPCAGDAEKAESILLEWLKDKGKKDIAKIALPIFSASATDGIPEELNSIASKDEANALSKDDLVTSEQSDQKPEHHIFGQMSNTDEKESDKTKGQSLTKTKDPLLFASLVNEKDLRNLPLQGECLRKLVSEMKNADQVEALVDFFANFREKCIQSPDYDRSLYSDLFATFLDRAFKMHQRSSWPIFRSFVAKLVFTDCFDEEVSQLFYKILTEQKLFDHAALFAIWFETDEDRIIEILNKGSKENFTWCSEVITAVVKKKLVPRVTRTLFFDSLVSFCLDEVQTVSEDQFDDLVGSVLCQLHEAGLEGELELLLLTLNSISDSILISFDSTGGTFRLTRK
ncbi:Nbas N and Sec39 domain containing protein [Trichuris trichiura]|uniref:Nbas N and Sec39 domain containing protein n=1 Tax=Trichuris trichiura TaxID=36087 RepID=A0A077ZHH7_TRITR|nr:Nbas N and Sec39 domain containing protein [Trichuris trichiura]